MRARFGELRLSPVYESEAQGFDGDPFYNLVLSLRCRETPPQLVAVTKQIEAAHGRQPGAVKFAPRTLDLDLLLHGDRVVESPDLRLPHPDILRYAFVLRPLAELAPGLLHPALGQTMTALWQTFDGPDALLPVVVDLD